MNTKIIGNYDRFINMFSKTGRVKNKMYKELYHNGMKEIREREISKDQFVLLASKQVKNGRSSMTFGVDMQKGYVQKETGLAKMMLPFDRYRSSIVKHFTDWQGNLIARLTKSKVFDNGKTVDSKIVKEIPGKYAKVCETSVYTPVRRSVNVEYANGNKYAFAEYKTGHREYNRTVDGVEYSFSSKKD